MKFIQTLYIDKNLNFYENSFGWFKPEYHLMSWTLSCLQLNKHCGNVELYANSPASRILIDTLELPYTKIHTEIDDLKLIHPQLWALPKLYTYSLQNSPFLHIDGDVFIFSDFPKNLIEGNLIAQNFEEATEYYTSTQRMLQNEFIYFPECVEKDFKSGIPITAVNAGIMGGNNISFFKEYTSLAFDYINKNAEKLQYINVDSFNVFFEQHLFYSLASQKNIPINVLFTDYVKDNEYKYLGNFHEVPCCRNYLHLLGHFKKDEFTCIKMAEKLRDLYPEYYYRIASIFKKNKLPFYTSIDTSLNIEEEELNKKASKSYNNSKYKIGRGSTTISKEGKLSVLLDIAEKELNFIVEENSVAEMKERIREDFLKFKNYVDAFLKNINKDYLIYLYGRDIEAVNWYCNIFANKENKKYLNKQVVVCTEIKIHQSHFDWAGIINKHKRVGVSYYESLEVTEGEFYNLLVPETINDAFSIFDIDEMDVKVLELLRVPVTLKQLLKKMELYVEEEVIKNNYEIYERYIVSIIEQLITKKAIKPFRLKIKEF